MSTLPHLLTLPAYMTEAMTNSLDVRVSRKRVGSMHPEPIQPIREIRASGFDAIVQITDDAMRAALNRSLEVWRTVDGPIPADLDAALADQLRDHVAAERIEAEVIAWPIRTDRVVVDLEPSTLQARWSLSNIQVSHEIAPTVSVRFSVALSVIATETAASYGARVDQDSFNLAPLPFRGRLPAGSDPVSTDIAIGSTTVVVSGPVRTQVDARRFRIDAYLDFGCAEANIMGSSAWGSTAMDLVMPVMRGWSQRSLIPPIQLFGDPPSLPVSETTRFDVTVIGLPSNQMGSLLSFCIEAAAGTSAPDPTQVGAFTGSGNFAFFATVPVIQDTVLSRWRSFPRRAMEWTAPLTFERDGIRRQASARVKYELGDAHWATLSYGTEHMSDNILVYANFTSQALSARLEGRDISSELGDLANSRTSREAFRLFPDHSPVQHEIEAIENWLLDVGRHVLPPLQRPVSSAWSLRGDYETQVSTPLSAMVTRGVLI